MRSRLPSPAPSPDDVLGTREISNVLKLSEKTVLTLAAAGKLPLCKLGNQWRVRRATLLAWLDQQSTK